MHRGPTNAFLALQTSSTFYLSFSNINEALNTMSYRFAGPCGARDGVTRAYAMHVVACPARR
jgi:hypothetical protein